MHILTRLLLVAVFLLSSVIVSYGENMPMNNIKVSFDIEHNLLRGESGISLPSGQTARINVSGLKILSAKINDRTLAIEPGLETITFSPGTPEDILNIKYEAEFNSMPETDRSMNPGVVHGNLIGTDGIVLTDSWYPSFDGLLIYNLTAVLPAGFEGISEAEGITVKEVADGKKEFSFLFHHPVRDINLVAGRYIVERDTYNETELYAYFFMEDKELAKTYIEYTKKYLEMYEELLGKYPFRRFSIVENILPTGYSMPTFTLLGQDVVRLPFIVETSLGHEILHQWFGNLVYSDYTNGNWSEGLTTYLADHRYKEIKGEGRDSRKQALISFQSYVNAENDLPLKSFSGRTDRVSGAIGYGKSAMVFHMLKNITGEDVFYDSLKTFIGRNKFKVASWDNIREAFESVSGKTLDWFFGQWIDEKGIPDIELHDVNLNYIGSKAVVSFEIFQRGGKYKLAVPVTLKLKDGEINRVFETDKESASFEIETEGAPVELLVDSNYDLFRKLSDQESPPVISGLLGAKKKLFVIPSEKSEEYSVLSGFLKNEGLEVKKEEDLKHEDLKKSSLIIPGADTGIVKKLFGTQEERSADFSFVVRRNPFSSKDVIALIYADSASEMSRYIEKITHYGKYSRISFKDGRNVLKEIESSDNGLREKIAEDIIGIELPRVVSISDVIEKVKDKKVVYVGEGHDRFEHHRVQLEVIRELHRKNKKIAIGMEMFQKPFQKVLGDYISGEIEEKEFLKKSEYFKRWGFDYNLYREILLYAREYKIPVLALNIRKEIVSKVAKEGLLSLSSEELKEVPSDMDLSDMEYRNRLKDIFEKHRRPENRNFDFFYEAQVLWDESMAHNLDEFIQKYPEYQLVVIAGMGHMAFGSGIPKRAFRLNKMEYSVILNDNEIAKNIADFVLLPPFIKPPESPKLMVLLNEEEGRVKIEGFAPGSISRKAGLKKDDIILSVDDTKVEGIDDLKIFLLYKKRGDEVTVRVLRKRFLFGTAEPEFKIKLQ